MSKRIFSLLVVALLAFAPTLALAAPGDARVAVGKDLTDAQKKTVYALFNIKQGDVQELQVTIDEEKQYLGGKVPADKIGSHSISSVYIKEMDPGYGITVETHNIDWVTSEMYIAALNTAGIADAQIVVAAPTSVSGTAALTGLFKCYESITGKPLSEEAKDVANQELVTTGQLADFLGSKEALELMNQLKIALAEAGKMTDDELRQTILDEANAMGVQLTDQQIDQLIALLRRLNAMDLDPQQMLQQAQKLQSTLNTLSQVQQKTTGFLGAIGNAFSSVGKWFKNLFS